MATIAIARRAPARRSTASEHRAIRRKSRTLHIHSKHASSFQTAQNGAGIVRKAPRAAAEMTLKQQALAEIKAAWQRIEKYNLEFGRVLCEWRDKFKAKGFRKEGDGVSPILDELGIPKSSAYYWMNRYEISIGVKSARPEKQKLDAPPLWTHADEKRANRSEPIACIEKYKILAKKMLEAGFSELLKKKAADQSHLWAAKDWAKLRLDFGDAFED
jgi:hypothetical protein